jgi:LysM repeat protein
VKENEATQQMVVNRSPDSHVVEVGETLTTIADKYACTVKDLQKWNELEGEVIYAGQNLSIQSEAAPVVPVSAGPIRRYPFIDNRYSHYSSRVVLDYPVNSISLEGQRSQPEQVQSMLYGMVLENTRSKGILYHTIGVNGAQYEHFNASSHFIEQLSELTPDLIIVSLGTNETISGGFSPEAFYRQVDELIVSLEKNMPHASILITTPPDTYLARRYVNPNGSRAKDLLFNYSMNNDLACWNLYDIMGGEGAMDLWYKNGLAQNDRIHFTGKGYGLQGDLLFEALMNGYGAFQSYRPH